jgi:hypothetical protein
VVVPQFRERLLVGWMPGRHGAAANQGGYQLPMANIHRVIGMGSDQMLDALLPPDRDKDGDARLSSAHSALYGTYWTLLRPLPGAGLIGC